MEHILSTNIICMLIWISSYSILCMEQHRFHKEGLVTHSYISTLHDFATGLNSSAGQINALLLDLLKAFDKVSHVRLCHKLSSYQRCI